MCTRGYLAPAILGVAMGIFAGCTSQPDQASSASQEQKLTPERAKVALLEMMRSQPGRDLGWFDGDIPEEMSKTAIVETENGWYEWTAAFRFHPSEAIYTFVVRPRPRVRACAFEYKGSFRREDGRWVATRPELVRTALHAGE